jgi:phosphoesterase RecJ-like protein
VPAEFETFRTLIESKTRFVLTTHMNQDGDGLGSEIALAGFLRRQGKQVSIVNISATPSNYQFLADLFPLLCYDTTAHASLIEDAEVIIVLDTNHLNRLGSMNQAVHSSKAIKICIDHHLEPGEFAHLYILDESSTATGEIVYRLLNYISSNSINRDAAIGLYTAIMTDTGSFRYPKTDSDTHKIIAHLIQLGADPVQIYEHVYEHGSINRLHLLGSALATMHTSNEGKIAYIVLTREMLDSTGTSEVDSDTFIPFTLAIEGVQIGLLFADVDGLVKISFRSKGDIWINELAKEFGGNGHKNAAGARLPHVTLSEIISQVLEHAAAYLI